MRNILLLSICAVLFSLCSLSPKADNALEDWTNKTVDTLLFFNNTVSAYQLKPKYRKLSFPFSTKEKELYPKGITHGYQLNSIDGRYYTVAERKDKYGYNYKLIAYNIEGENDTEILVSQLNSYRKGTLVDALILEMNFAFETECSARYTVKDSIIKIDSYEINNLLYAKDGDIIGTKAVPDTVIQHSVYKIRNGQFIMLPK